MFLRRLGHNSNKHCEGGYYCPQVLELADGDFAVVGQDMTETAKPAMPPGPGVGPGERVVRVPRRVFLAIKSEIPAA
jgi:hypothetical protein